MHRYRLATYRECRAHREWNTTCPACGRKGKFSPYIDTATMRPIDDHTCGRCNRLSNCAYHLPPREMKPLSNPPYEGGNLVVRSREKSGPMNYISHRSHKSHESARASLMLTPHRPSERGVGVTLFYSRMHCAMKESQPWGHHLATWLRTRFTREQVDAALKRYHVGGTPDGATLWWQIDEQGRVHTGKAMQYNPLTGHRVKEGTHLNPPSEGGLEASRCQHPLPHREGWGGSFPVNWAHRMRLYGEPTDLIVSQCLFGLHLAPLLSTQGGKIPTTMSESLPLGGGRKGALVESEKTALILSLLCPDKIWLATGGKQNFKEQMLWPLIGYEVEVYPDADALTDWYVRAMEMNRTIGTRLYIPTWYYNLMDHDEARAAGHDLADIINN